MKVHSKGHSLIVYLYSECQVLESFLMNVMCKGE